MSKVSKNGDSAIKNLKFNEINRAIQSQNASLAVKENKRKLLEEINALIEAEENDNKIFIKEKENTDDEILFSGAPEFLESRKKYNI